MNSELSDYIERKTIIRLIRLVHAVGCYSNDKFSEIAAVSNGEIMKVFFSHSVPICEKSPLI